MQQYHHAVDTLIDHVQHSPNSPDALTQYQHQLDQLASRYQSDQTLGAERYKLYQAQAMISYWQGDYAKSRQFIHEAVRVRGHSFKLADELIAHLGPEPAFTPRSYKLWWSLIFGPFVALFLIAIAQIVVHFVLTTTVSSDGYSAGIGHSPVAVVLNILSVLLGIAAILGILGIPVWIIMLLKVKRYNEGSGTGLSRTVGILFAILLPPFYWLYTYERDRVKFWLNLGLCVITFGYFGIVSWIWGIIEAANHTEAYYTQFPHIER